MPVPTGARKAAFDLTSPTYYEASARMSFTFRPGSLDVTGSVELPGATEGDMVAMTRALANAMRTYIETTYPAETWDATGSYEGTIPGDPWSL